MTDDVLNPATLLALITFAFVATATPGPNNFMLLASSANFGVSRTLPHAFGIAAGFFAMVIGVGLGVAKVLAAAPWAMDGLRTVCAVYVLWLAYKIAIAGRPEDAGSRVRPFRFHEAAFFQWVNPKAWGIILGALAVYAPGGGLGEVFLVALVFLSVTLPSFGLWMLGGRAINRFLEAPINRRIFNVGMAVLLTGSVFYALFM